MKINNKLLLLLVDDGINYKVLRQLNVNMKDLNIDTEYKRDHSKNPVKTNVAISAVRHSYFFLWENRNDEI